MLVLRVYARLLLLPFFYLLYRRTQVVAPPIIFFRLPSFELFAGVTMELFVVICYVVLQLALIVLLLCFSVLEFVRVMA